MQINPYTLRDFSRGRIAPSAVADSLIPENSVSHSLNVNFDTIIGSGVVRLGTTLFNQATAIGYAPLGLGTFTTSGSTTNIIIGVFKGASNASLYWFNTSGRNTSNLTSLSNTAKVRFAQLGNRFFMANGVDAMKSTSGGTTWNTNSCLITHSTVGLLLSTKSRMLASGHPTYRSRVFFSSIVSSTTQGVGVLTWDDDNTDGDWIDVNPDDGDDNTGFAETSDVILVFKSNHMYRLNAVTKTVDVQNIFDIGAVSQEAITAAQGVVYFFSGQDIRRTVGGFPEQISRLGCQDFIDAIPQANWSSVAAGTDGLNVYFSIGDVTLNSKQDTEQAYTDVVLKFSPRDQSWSIHSYADTFQFFTQYTNTSGRTMIGAETLGKLQTMNSGVTDNTKAIFYDLISQDLEFGDLSHTKKISDKLVVYSRFSESGGIQIQEDDKKAQDIEISLDSHVSVGKDINAEGNSFKVRWFGNSVGQSPVFEGFEIPSITDSGITR